MKCLNCGMENQEGVNFCMGCGNPLQNNIVNPTNGGNVNNNQNIQNSNVQNVNMSNNINNNVASTESINYFSYIVGIMLKPSKIFKEEKGLNDTKNSFVLTLIVSCLMTLVTLVTTIIGAVKTYDFWEGKTTWEFSNLKNLNYIELIGKNLIIYVASILLITVIFYIGTLIVKKETKFQKILAASSSSMLPFIALSLIVAPLVANIWAPLSMIVMVSGFIYGVVILYELINSELQFEGDMKIYFNAICFILLICISAWASFKFMPSSLGDINNIMGMLG